jgi:hypothetical protein
MQFPRRGRATTTIWTASGAVAALAASGCAHHRADQYSYAPPYAPPVYPQPQAPAPAAYASAPAAVIPAGAVPTGVVPAAPVMAAPAAGQAGEVVVAAGSPCPPCATEGIVVGATAMMDGGGQTTPCPPGP